MAENPNEQTTDNWLQVIRFLRREKNLAVSNMNALSAENLRFEFSCVFFDLTSIAKANLKIIS